jgi:hypothetical protein
MTMRIVIENTDQSRKARVITRQRETFPDGELIPQPNPVEIAPGASQEVWIHNGKDCIIEEV